MGISKHKYSRKVAGVGENRGTTRERRRAPYTKRLTGLVIKDSGIEGEGVFAGKGIKARERIAYFHGHTTSQRSRYSLTVGDAYIEPTGTLNHLNHSCIPNAVLRGRWLMAWRDIAMGEEILIDYRFTEEKILHHFRCRCGSSHCRGKI